MIADLLEGVHQRVLDGVPTASRDLFVQASGPLTGFLTNQFPRLTDDERHDLVVDALLEYLRRPDDFDDTKSSLWSYLCLIAKRNAIDLSRRLANRARLLDKKVQSDVEFWASQAKYEQSGEDAIDARRIMELHGGRLARNEPEARVLKLILEDESSTTAFSEALGIDAADPDAERLVKQTKDRLMLRMKRLRDDL